MGEKCSRQLDDIKKPVFKCFLITNESRASPQPNTNIHEVLSFLLFTWYNEKTLLLMESYFFIMILCI